MTLDVSCDGANHQLEWSDGVVRMCQHPNADAELALVGLGGPEPACLELWQLWTEAVADGGFLEDWVIENQLSESYLSWLGMALERMRLEGFQEFLRGLPIKRAARMGQFIHTFPLAWLDRAAAEASHAVDAGDGVVCGDAPRLLTEAAAVRVRRALVNAVGTTHLSLGAAALVKLDIRSRHGLAASIEGSIDSSSGPIRIDVSPRWLHTTWARGASIIEGQLILGLDDLQVDEDTGEVVAAALAVGWVGGHATMEARSATFESNRWTLGPPLDRGGQ